MNIINLKSLFFTKKNTFDKVFLLCKRCGNQEYTANYNFVKVKKNGVFHECQVLGFFEILELKFTSVNEHFKI